MAPLVEKRAPGDLLQKTIYQRLNAVLWTLIVTLVVLLAVYVSVGRMLMSNMGAYQAGILQELNARVPFIIEAERVSGEWHSFTPVLVLSNLRLSPPRGDLRPLTLSEGRIAIDVLDSLRSGSLQMTRVELESLALRGELSEDGRFRLEGIDGSGGEIGEWLREFLLNVELISLRQNTLNLGLPGGERRQLDLSLRLERDGSRRRLDIELASSRGARINILGEGVGDPFNPELFSGELYARVSTQDLGAVKQVLSNRLTGTWAEGTVDVQAWLAFDRGETSLQGRLLGSDLVVVNEERDWKIPLQQVALEAEFVQGRDRWTVFGTGLELAQGGVVLGVPRLQLDGWGQALRLRATDVPLAPLADLVVDSSPAQGRVEEIVQKLDPAGSLSSLQLSIGDIGSPGEDWEVEARFRDLSVSSWRGAPGVRSATGYVEVFPGQGLVLLDSPNLELAFPTIYSEPLDYSDFRGAINLDWEPDYVRLTSDLIVAEGSEGRAKALFGLDIPLVANDVGLDMSLLVGLENSHPIHRVKYVPVTLSETLRGWLSDSIGDGLVEQGAFLWRGSLKRGAPELRTVQLAFNIRDTHVDYHPRWPAVDVASGVILVDDSEVSVWADEATLFDSTIQRLSVETWRGIDGDLLLGVDGRMLGSGADGLAVINDSPIDDVVKGAFRQWTLQGGLELELDLELNLSDKTDPPRVDVQTQWQAVDLDILPGNVPLRDINGGFSYHSSRGFSSEGLGGTIWDKPFTLDVLHPGLGSDRSYDPGKTITEVRAATRADMADVRNWVKFESLAFASGETSADIRLQVKPGEAPRLTVKSGLEGVALDFPRPWAKDSKQRRDLRLDVALGAQGGPLAIQLGDDLALDLDLREGGLRAAALGIKEAPGALETGSLRVTGHAELVQGDEWGEFISTYFAAGGLTEPGSQVTAPDDAGPGNAPAGLAIAIEDLQVDLLEIWGQSVADVGFSLRVDAGRWQLLVDTDWLEAEYRESAGQDDATLLVRRLDLLGAQQLELEGQKEVDRDPVQAPTMQVAVDRLHRGDLELGNLTFQLRSVGPALLVTDITGEIAELQLGNPQPGQLTWQQEKPAFTSLQLGIGFDDLGETLARLGYERIVETRGGNFDIDLRWPGAPQGISLKQGEGAVAVAIQEGRFLEAPSGASGALKVANILNLADIVRRLSLSHMFESGIPFDSVEGEIFLHAGTEEEGSTIEVAGMEVSGPSSFSFSGVSNVKQRSLDGELVATLPVADNLPWVAALTAGLPVAAGVFLVSKILQKQVDQLSSAVYSIEGSWDDPQIEFAHIFDSGEKRQNGAQARSGSGLEERSSAGGSEELPREDTGTPSQSEP